MCLGSPTASCLNHPKGEKGGGDSLLEGGDWSTGPLVFAKGGQSRVPFHGVFGMNPAPAINFAIDLGVGEGRGKKNRSMLLSRKKGTMHPGSFLVKKKDPEPFPRRGVPARR